ncbi:tyrosine-type recombinase/integrase [Acidisoma sp. S159]|uniref:tyrosine-type recombinase/integrase n=1 Tax=Acidisoma sp. S159 TaxID=1747225 RepID=UPI00131D45E2|nr:tyrosine-type recombinase/integrase [Acidisoma sp. S159]
MLDLTETRALQTTQETAIFESLAAHAEAARDAYAKATEAAFRADTRLFAEWCAAAGLVSLPATGATLAAFIDAMALVKKPASIRRYCSSISRMHIAAKLSNPMQTDEARLGLRRMGRTHPAGRAQRQAAPLNRARLEKLLAVVGQGPRALRNAALLSVAYDSLARQSELAALRVEDLTIASDDSGTITIRRSKTDAEGVGSARYLGPDTVRAVLAWLAAAGSPASGPLFVSVLRGEKVTSTALRGADIARLWKELGGRAGLSAEEVAAISGHSTRVGAAQDQVAAGIGLAEIMVSGGWKTPEMVARYSRNLEARRSGSAKLAILQNRA